MDLAKHLTLNWSDFTCISDLTSHPRNEAGVYIWGFTIDKVFIPYYVGIADNIIVRIFEHINSIISGKYAIFHRDSLAQFKNFKDQDVQADMTKGKIYNPDWPNGFKTFLDKRKEFQPHLDFMVDNFTFSYMVVTSEIVSKQDLKEIEKICIQQIGKENLANTRAGNSDKFIITHSGNYLLTNIFTSTDH